MANKTGEVIREALTHKGWDQAELARATGLAPATISRYVRGSEKPSRKSIAAMSEALGIEVVRLNNAVAADTLPGASELTRVPDLSRLREIEDYNGLPREAQRELEDEIKDEYNQIIEDASDEAMERVLRRRRRRGTIGGIGDN